MISTNFGNRPLVLPTSSMSLYMTDDHKLFVIRPTDPVSHPNALLYHLGEGIMQFSDLKIPECEEVIYLIEIQHEYENFDTWWDTRSIKLKGGGMISATQIHGQHIVIVPVFGEVSQCSRRDSKVYVKFKVRVESQVEYNVVNPV